MEATEHLKILMLEDAPDDVALIQRELLRAGMSFSATVVNKRTEYEDALYNIHPDVILSDHSLPAFNSIEALRILRSAQEKLNLTTPFILVTGAVSEEFAVQCIKNGADDYILKDRLKRLPASITNSVEKARLDAERRKYLQDVIENEAMLRQAQHLANLGSWEADLVNDLHKWSDEFYRLYGYTPGEVQPGYERMISHVHAEDVGRLKQNLEYALANLDTFEHNYRILDRHGKLKYVHSKFVISRDAEKQPVKITGFLLDITQETEYIQKIKIQNEKLKEIAWIQSHGVRAPLARIMGLINLINTEKTDAYASGEVLNMILASVEELDSLVRSVVKKTEGLADV